MQCCSSLQGAKTARPCFEGARTSGDKARPGQRPHARATSTQVGVMAVVQGGQGNRQARL